MQEAQQVRVQRAGKPKARPLAKRLDRAFDRCAKHLGHALGRGARALTGAAGAAVQQARALPASEVASPYVLAAAALAVAPAIADLAAGPAAGVAFGLVRDVGVVLVAAGAVRAVVLAEGQRHEPWTPVFRAAMRRAHAEGRCCALVVEACHAATRWADGERGDAARLAASGLSAHLIDALLERAPSQIATRLGTRAIAAVPFAAGARTAVAAVGALRDATALVRLVEAEARLQMLHRPAVVIALDAWRERNPDRAAGTSRGRQDRDERVSLVPREGFEERSAQSV
jgi:hypothetical protein